MSWSFFFFFVGTNTLLAQTQLAFMPMFAGSDLKLETFYKLENGDSLQIETFKFYISGIELLNKGKTVWQEENSFHLVDASIPKSLTKELKTPKKLAFNQLKFNLGIDSTTNVSGALGGDLDPTLGMYWTWQSGYINFKLEGSSNRCSTRNNEFQFHLGGYESSFNALKNQVLKVKKKDKIVILLQIEKFIQQVDLSKQNHIMSPSKDAVLLSQKALEIFIIER